jgi:NADP-dependent 3-hydroxy acid dehydrogenase YdfG
MRRITKVLVTGANRGLGFEVVKALSGVPHLYEIHATARDTVCLKSLFQYKKILAHQYLYDLITTKPEELQNLIMSIKPDVIINCASPYSLKPLREMTIEETTQYYHCALLDAVLTQTFVNICKEEKTTGVLVHTGAIIGMPNFHERGLVGMLKSNQLKLINTTAHEVIDIHPPIYPRYINLGSFRDEVAPQDEKKFLKTADIAIAIVDMIEHPDIYPIEYTMASDSNLEDYKKYNLQRSPPPQKEIHSLDM